MPEETNKDKWLNEQLARIKNFAEPEYNWNDLELDPPNTWAQDWMEKIIRYQHSIGFCKGTVVPDREGGLTVRINKDNKYADIAAVNCGEILPLTDNGSNRLRCWNVEPEDSEVQKAVRKIRSFF